MGVFSRQLVLLAHQRIDHHVGSEPTLLSQLAQPSDRHIQSVSQGLRQTGAVLNDRIELLTAKHSGCQGLAKLQQGRLRLGGRSARDAQCLRDALGKGERVLLLTAEHPHRLL